MNQPRTPYTLMTFAAALCLAAVLTPHSAFSAEAMGGSDRGGGNAVGSTEAEVRAGLQDAKLKLGVILHYGNIYKNNVLNPALVQDPVVRKVLTKWFGSVESEEPIMKDLYDSPYALQNQDCTDENNSARDASTAHQRGAKICFSLKRLKRFPSWTLDAQLIALAAHEHAHHFGFNEVEAAAIQNYIFSVHGFTQVQYKLADFYGDLENYRSRLKSGYSPKDTPAAIAFAKRLCRDMAAIEGFAVAYGLRYFGIGLQVYSCDPNDFNPDSIEKELRELENKSVAEFNRAPRE